tara:strand:- start:894 stop:2051 length:1158 start_codon:yes stop_codon:yes gene_type:complete
MNNYIPPIDIFGSQVCSNGALPRIFFSANRYVQGAGVIDSLAKYIGLVGSSRPLLIVPNDLPDDVVSRVTESLSASEEIDFTVVGFEGECCDLIIDKYASAASAAGCDAVIALGGGKAIDTAKSTAYKICVPVVICPTLASSDAPCSALAVIYSCDGVFQEVRFFPGNPDLVIVDTEIIANAPVRFLLAGIADALATGYEVAACVANPNARSMLGGGISLAAQALAELCTRTIHDKAHAAVNAVRSKRVTNELEDVIEANTLLSGTGFESGGTALTHAVATALTVLPEVEHKFMHGEMVAVGLVTQLMMENNFGEYERVVKLFREIGLPCTYSDLGLNLESGDEAIRKVIESAFDLPFIHNQPFKMTPENLRQAMVNVDLGFGLG